MNAAAVSTAARGAEATGPACTTVTTSTAAAARPAGAAGLSAVGAAPTAATGITAAPKAADAADSPDSATGRVAFYPTARRLECAVDPQSAPAGRAAGPALTTGARLTTGSTGVGVSSRSSRKPARATSSADTADSSVLARSADAAGAAQSRVADHECSGRMKGCRAEHSSALSTATGPTRARDAGRTTDATDTASFASAASAKAIRSLASGAAAAATSTGPTPAARTTLGTLTATPADRAVERQHSAGADHHRPGVVDRTPECGAAVGARTRWPACTAGATRSSASSRTAGAGAVSVGALAPDISVTPGAARAADSTRCPGTTLAALRRVSLQSRADQREGSGVAHRAAERISSLATAAAADTSCPASAARSLTARTTLWTPGNGRDQSIGSLSSPTAGAAVTAAAAQASSPARASDRAVVVHRDVLEHDRAAVDKNGAALGWLSGTPGTARNPLATSGSGRTGTPAITANEACADVTGSAEKTDRARCTVPAGNTGPSISTNSTTVRECQTFDRQTTAVDNEMPCDALTVENDGVAVGVDNHADGSGDVDTARQTKRWTVDAEHDRSPREDRFAETGLVAR